VPYALCGFNLKQIQAKPSHVGWHFTQEFWPTSRK